MISKISKYAYYTSYYTQLEFKVREAACKLEYELSRAFRPRRKMPKFKKMFKKHFRNWPKKSWDDLEKTVRLEYIAFCFPPPIGLPETQTSPEDPAIPRRQVRQDLWVDLSYGNREILRALEAWLKGVREDEDSLPPQQRQKGGRSDLSQINKKLEYLMHVTRKLADAKYAVEAPVLLRANKSTLECLQKHWRCWRVGRFFTRESRYGYNTNIAPAAKRSMLRNLDKCLFNDFSKLKPAERGKLVRKLLLPLSDQALRFSQSPPPICKSGKASVANPQAKPLRP